MKLNYQVISSNPLKIKFFYEQEEKYGEFYINQLKRDAKDANNPTDKLGIRGEVEIVAKDKDYALDLSEAFAEAMEFSKPKPKYNLNKIFGARNMEKDIYHAGGVVCNDTECAEAHFPF